MSDQELRGTKRAEQEKRLERNMARVGSTIVVLSGKGGVGKSTVAVNLAWALALRERRVGILDVDIHGPDIAKMLGVESARLTGTGGLIEPVAVRDNLRAVSLAFALEDPDQPVIWRGPLKMATIKQFLSDVNWGELDYLVVDSPPGTGDEPLSVCQLIPKVSGAVIVTTPQDVAVLDARKCVRFARDLDIKVIGVIENMGGFTCPHCGGRIDLFKLNGGEKAAADLGVPFLGRIPFDPVMVELADQGVPFAGMERTSGAGWEPSRAFLEIVQSIEKHLEQKEE